VTDPLSTDDPVVKEAEELARRGRLGEAVDHLRASATRTGDQRRRALYSYYWGAMLRRTGQLAEAKRRFDEALALAGGSDVLLRAQIQLQQADLASRMGEGLEAQALLQATFPVLRTKGGSSMDLAYYHLVSGHLSLAAGTTDAAHKSYERARGLFRSAAEHTEEAYTLMMLGDCHYQSHDFGKALAYYHHALKTLDRGPGDLLLLGHLYATMANTHRELGETEKARQLYGDAQVMLKRCNDRRGMALALANRAYLQVRAGRLDDAEVDYRSSRALEGEVGDRRLSVLNAAGLARLLSRRGDLTAAATEAQAGLAASKAVADSEERAMALAAAAEVAMAQGQHGTGAAYLQEAHELLVRTDRRIRAAEVLFEWAKMDHRAGRTDEAMMRLQEVITFYIEMGLRTEERRVLTEWETIVSAS